MTAAVPFVSMVVAARDAERTIGAALESAIAQTYEAFEVIVVDDGSKDRTAAVARSFNRVCVLDGPGRGPSAARNAGSAVAKGSLLAFLDADDILPPSKLTDQAGYLATHPETDCVLGRQEVFLENERPAWLERDSVFGDFGGVPLMSLVVRRRVFDAVGGFDESLRIAEDRDLLVRLRAKGVGIAVLDTVVLHRRIHDRNLSLLRPEQHPVLRSLHAKLSRERIAEATADAQKSG